MRIRHFAVRSTKVESGLNICYRLIRGSRGTSQNLVHVEDPSKSIHYMQCSHFTSFAHFGNLQVIKRTKVKK